MLFSHELLSFLIFIYWFLSHSDLAVLVPLCSPDKGTGTPTPDSETHPHEPSSSIRDRPTEEEDDDDGVADPIDTSDSKSLGSLDTESGGEETDKESRQNSFENGKDTVDRSNHKWHFKDSYDVERARNIVLKRVTQQQEYWGAVKDDDNDLESDVVSALVGINIDVDSPPSSPESRRVEDHPELPSAKSSVSDRPFDEAILSQCSSRERHTEDLSTLRYKLNIGNLSQQGAARNYPYMVQEHMMLGRSGSDPRSGMNAVFGENLSDLTPSFGQSSSSSLSEVLARTKIANIPPLLERRGSIGDPTSPRSPSRMEQSIGGRSHTSPINSKTQKNGRSEKARISIQEQSMQPPQDHDDDNVESQEEGDRSYGDDESSDPFEGYEDFDMNEASNDDVSSNYGGDSESKGYTRFSREDFLSESNDCSSEADFDAGVESEHVVGITHSDVRETPSVSTSNCDDSPVPSPVSSNTEVDRQGEKKSKTLPSASSGAISPTPSAMRKPDNLGVSSSARSLFESSRESPSTTPTPKKEAIEQGDRFHDMQALNLPGNRIVKALSHYSELRLRRRQNRRFHALDTCKEDNEEGGEGQAAATKQQTTNSSLQLDCLNEFDEDHDVVGPIPFISMRSPSQEDDVVSQITFAHDDYTASNANKKSSHWWGPFGGLTAGKLDSWFQNNYLNQAVEAAEGFLSANVIHAQMKSKPLDFEPDEDDKDEDDNDVVDTQIVGKTEIIESTSIPGAQEIVMACSPIPSDMLYAPTNNALEAPLSPGGRSTNSNRSKQSLKASTSSAEQPKPNAERSLALVPSASRADHKPNDSAGNSALAKEILRYEELLSQYEAEASKRNKTSPKVAGTLFRLAVLYIQNDDVQKALKATKDTSRMQKSLGDLADTSRSLHLLADIYVRKGEYDAALTCYTEVQGIEYQLYGYIHEETANTLNRIGSVLARKGDFDAAIEKHKEALTILKEYHGEELRHPLVSQTLIHIGAVYYRERNSLATVRKKNDSYSTFIEAGMLEVIGRAHEDRGSYKMAIAFFEEKLQCLNLNWNDPKSATTTAELDDISTTLNSLGMLSCRAGFYMEAIDYYDRALEVQKMVGCDKMHLATAKVLTATVQFQLGYFQKALSLLQEALKELQAITGKNHETVAATWFQIGVVRVALCDYDDAMDAFEEALRIQTKLLGKHHPATLRTRREIGNMYAIYESELEAAFIQFHDILENQKRIHGQKHPNVAETLHSLGCAYARKGEYRKAIKVLEECYYMRLDFLGSDHPLQASTLYEIAHIHIKRERFKKAVHICNAILEIRRESLSEQHIDLARALATRGSCLVVTGDYNEALKCFEEAFLVAKKAVGNTHPAVADIHILFAAMHLRKCNFDEAKGEITKALAIYQNSNLDGDHPSLKDAVALMERVERDEMLCV